MATMHLLVAILAKIVIVAEGRKRPRHHSHRQEKMTTHGTRIGPRAIVIGKPTIAVHHRVLTIRSAGVEVRISKILTTVG